MNKKKGNENTDSCRDLNGRRLSTIKEAKKLAEYVASAPEREAAKREEAKARLTKLQEEIQRIDGGNTSGSDKASGSNAGASTSKAGVKRRLDDQKFVEESREMVDNVKNAVAAGELAHTLSLSVHPNGANLCCDSAMMKKRKLAKTASPAAVAAASSPSSTTQQEDTPPSAASLKAPDASEIVEPSTTASTSAPAAASVSASA